MQIIVNKLLIHYQVVGRGKVVLVLHGWGDNSQSWQNLQKVLSESYKVITVDLPGFGASDAPKEDWRLDDYAHFIGSFLEKIRKEKTYSIIGHSNGGAIAIRGLVNKDIVTEKLVLLGSAGVRGEYKGHNKTLRYVTKTGKILTTPLPKSLKQNVRKKVYKAVGSDMLVAEHLQGTFKNVVEDDVRKDAAAIAIPTLLIYGEQDSATPSRYGRIFQELIKKSKLEIVPKAGHFVYQDKPKETLEFIKEFLK